MSRCPPIDKLEAFVLHGSGGDTIGQHIATCAACGAMAKEVRDNQRFLVGFGSAILRIMRGPAKPVRPPNPLIVPGYELVEEIGRGGQGVVYRAIQKHTKRLAAVKMLLRGEFATPKQRSRFEREIELAASLRHPSIVTVFESGQAADGSRYVAMEFVEGLPLDVFARTRLTDDRNPRARIDAIAKLFAEIADGVGHAHSSGVIHRDLKPSNILVGRDGRPRVLDFGLASQTDALDAARELRASRTHEFAGTPAFAAPEQLTGVGGITARTDVYSLGLAMYVILTGKHPYPCDGPIADVIEHATNTESEPLSMHLPKIPADLETIVLKALAKDPSRRYSSGNSLASELNRYLQGDVIEARRDSTVYVLRKLAAKHRTPVLVGILFLCTIIASMIGLALLARNLNRTRDQAVTSLAESQVRGARLRVVNGETELAEKLLWAEAKRCGLSTAGQIGLEGNQETIRCAWSLIELYSRVPRRFRARGEQPYEDVGIDSATGAIWALSHNGVQTRWSLSGAVIAQSPPIAAVGEAWGGRASRNGRFFTTIQNKTLFLHDIEHPLVPLSAALSEFEPMSVRFIFDDGSHVALIDVKRGRDVVLLERRNELLCEVNRWQDGANSLTFCPGQSGTRLAIVTFAGKNGRVVIREGFGWPTVGEIARRDFVAEEIADGLIRGAAIDSSGHRLVLAVGGGVRVVGISSTVPSLLGAYETQSPYVLLANSDDLDRTFASFTSNGEILIFDARISTQSPQKSESTAELKPVSRLQEAPGIRTVAYADANETIAVLGENRDLSVYDAHDRPWLARLHTEKGTNACVAIALDGTIAWGNENGDLFVYASDGAVSHATGWKAHTASITAVEFAPDNSNELLTSSLDGGVKSWQRNGTLLREYTNESSKKAASCAQYSPDGSKIASGRNNGIVQVWRRDDGTDLPPLDGRCPRQPKIAFSPDGRFLAAMASNEQQLGNNHGLVWDLMSGKPRHRLSGHSLIIRAINWSPDGRWIATGSDDKTVRIWNAATGACVHTIEGLPWGPWDVLFHPSGRVLFVTGPGGQVVVIDPEVGKEVATLLVHEKSIFDIAISPDGRKLYTSGQDSWIGTIDFDRLRSYIRGNESFWSDQASPLGPPFESQQPSR